MLRYFSFAVGVELNENWILHHLHSREFLFRPSLVEAASFVHYAKRIDQTHQRYVQGSMLYLWFEHWKSWWDVIHNTAHLDGRIILGLLFDTKTNTNENFMSIFQPSMMIWKGASSLMNHEAWSERRDHALWSTVYTHWERLLPASYCMMKSVRSCYQSFDHRAKSDCFLDFYCGITLIYADDPSTI